MPRGIKRVKMVGLIQDEADIRGVPRVSKEDIRERLEDTRNILVTKVVGLGEQIRLLELTIKGIDDYLKLS